MFSVGRSLTIVSILITVFCTVEQPRSIRATIVNNELDGDFQESQSRLPAAMWETFVAIRGAIREHQYRPPTDQEFALSMARSIFVLGGKDEPVDLAEKASRLMDDVKTREFLDIVWADLKLDLKDNSDLVERAIIESMLAQTSNAAQFVTAKENRVQKQLSENQYVGIGIQVMYQAPYTKIAMPFPRGTAWEAGIVKNDLILEVDGKPMKDVPLAEVIDTLRGLEGTKVKVKVRNEDSGKERVYTIPRKVIPIDTVVGAKMEPGGTWDYRFDDSGLIAYLRFNRIIGSTAAEFKTVSNVLQRKGFKAVVLDFRSINQVEIHHARLLADMFLGEGSIGSFKTRQMTQELNTRADHVLNDFPMAALIPERVPGPLFLLLERLQATDRASLIGPACQSDLLCRKRVELPKGLGAVTQIPFAKCVLSADSTLVSARNTLSAGGLAIALPPKLKPDIATSDTDEQFKEAAMLLGGDLKR